MDNLCWIIGFILFSVFIAEEGAERHHYRSRARHILIQNPKTRPHEESQSRPTTVPGSPVTTQTTAFDRPTSTITTQEPSSTTTRSSPHNENDPSTGRRGSQTPDSYTEGEWELIQQRIGNPPPTSSNPDSNQESSPDNHHQQQQQQNGQDTQPTQRPQGQGESQDPFLNRMSAMDYLTRRAHGNILQSRNNQQNREFSREMGEQMCEAFGKHYVSISIGGKCV